MSSILKGFSCLCVYLTKYWGDICVWSMNVLQDQRAWVCTVECVEIVWDVYKLCRCQNKTNRTSLTHTQRHTHTHKQCYSWVTTWQIESVSYLWFIYIGIYRQKISCTKEFLCLLALWGCKITIEICKQRGQWPVITLLNIPAFLTKKSLQFFWSL